MGIDRHRLTMDILERTKDLGYAQIAEHFGDVADEVANDFPNLQEPILYAAKGILALESINKKKRFSPNHLEKWRMNLAWLNYAKGALTEEIGKLTPKLEDLRSDLQTSTIKSLAKKGIRISDEKIRAELRKNEKFRELDRQLSVLRAILSHVVSHGDSYRSARDVLIQESTLTKHMMAH